MYEELVKKLRYCGNAVSCVRCPYWEGCEGSKEDLKHAADVRPVVRAKWESHGEGFKWVYICSGCGFVDGYPMNDRMHYCPNCGADMREES